jgi:chitinase
MDVSNIEVTAPVPTVWITGSVEFPPVTITGTRSRGDDRPTITWTYFPSPFPAFINDPLDDPNLPWPPIPPSGFPDHVGFSIGIPKPPCIPIPFLKTCGKRCETDCGAHGGGSGGSGGRPPGCVGPPSLCPNCIGLCSPSSGGGGMPGEPPPPDETCRRTTVSYCSRRCSVYDYPATTMTTCRDLDFTRTITACVGPTATDSKTTSTTTLRCPTSLPLVIPTAVYRMGDGGSGGFVVNPGEFSTMTDLVTPTTRTTSTSTRSKQVTKTA